MDFSLPNDVVDIVNGVVGFIDAEVLPMAEELDDILADNRRLYGSDLRYSTEVLGARRDIRMKSAAAGYYTMFGAPELGGGGASALAMVAVFEALYYHYGPDHPLIKNTVIPSPFTNGLTPLLNHVSREVREAYLPVIASGEATLCFALSEPAVGSDPQALETTATRQGDGWVLQGNKQWITNGAYADFAIVFAVTDRRLALARQGGISAFFVPAQTPGFTVDRIIPVMGHVGGDPAALHLEDVFVPEWAVVGELHRGLELGLMGITRGRLGLGGTCLGLAKWAHEQAIAYARQRETFGRVIAEYQAVQFMIADSEIDIYAAQNMVYNAAWCVDEGKAAIEQISMVKVFATEMVGRVLDRSIQIHGAVGLSNELGLERGYRQARAMRIPDGTSEIQRRTIAKRVLSRGVDH